MIFRQFFDKTSSTYTYLLGSRNGGEALLIDPVIEHVDFYIKRLHELDLKLVKAVDTHCHADHVTGLGQLRDLTRCITVMGDKTSADVVSIRVEDGDQIKIEDISLEVIYTPGHTDDSYCFFNNDRIFTGDTLLIRGTGRTDFQNGNPVDAYHSLFGKILTLDDDITVYPGHDYKGETRSTIGEEKKFNPRLQVSNAEEYADIMNNLNLPNPKLMDEAVPANQSIGFSSEEPDLITRTLSVKKARKLADNGDVLFVDLREQSEREKNGIIPNSLHAPYADLNDFIQPGGLLRTMVNESQKTLVLYCSYGERSALALQILMDANFTGIQHLKGGLKSWNNAGYDVERITNG